MRLYLVFCLFSLTSYAVPKCTLYYNGKQEEVITNTYNLIAGSSNIVGFWREGIIICLGSSVFLVESSWSICLFFVWPLVVVYMKCFGKIFANADLMLNAINEMREVTRACPTSLGNKVIFPIIESFDKPTIIASFEIGIKNGKYEVICSNYKNFKSTFLIANEELKQEMFSLKTACVHLYNFCTRMNELEMTPTALNVAEFRDLNGIHYTFTAHLNGECEIKINSQDPEIPSRSKIGGFNEIFKITENIAQYSWQKVKMKYSENQ